MGKYQLVGYILTSLTDVQFPSKLSWRAILRQQVLTSQYADNEKGVDAQRERMVVDQCCRHKQNIQRMEYL